MRLHIARRRFTLARDRDGLPLHSAVWRVTFAFPAGIFVEHPVVVLKRSDFLTYHLSRWIAKRAGFLNQMNAVRERLQDLRELFAALSQRGVQRRTEGRTVLFLFVGHGFLLLEISPVELVHQLLHLDL